MWAQPLREDNGKRIVQPIRIEMIPMGCFNPLFKKPEAADKLDFLYVIEIQWIKHFTIKCVEPSYIERNSMRFPIYAELNIHG